MSNWEQKLLNEVRDDVKTIVAQLPHLATKEELKAVEEKADATKRQISQHRTIFLTVTGIFSSFWVFIKGLPAIIENWTHLFK